MPTLAPCVGSHHCSCCHPTLDIAATSKINSPLSLVLCVSCFRVKVPGGHLLSQVQLGCLPGPDCQRVGEQVSVLCLLSWEVGPIFYQDAYCGRFPGHTKGSQMLGSLNTCTCPFPFHTFTTRMKKQRPFLSHSLL